MTLHEHEDTIEKEPKYHVHFITESALAIPPLLLAFEVEHTMILKTLRCQTILPKHGETSEDILSPEPEQSSAKI